MFEEGCKYGIRSGNASTRDIGREDIAVLDTARETDDPPACWSLPI